MAEGLRKGDRVRLTAEAEARGLRSRKGAGEGVIASEPRRGGRTYQVLWDGCICPQSYHRSFVEEAPQPAI